MLSKGFKLVAGTNVLVNKMGSLDQNYWRFKKATFSVISSRYLSGIALLRCKQTGERVERPVISAEAESRRCL